MVATVIINSIVFTLGILALTLFTISKGYSYKHTVDAKSPEDQQEQLGNK